MGASNGKDTMTGDLASPADRPTDQLLGQRPGNAVEIGGRYQLLEPIGEGGMARVYRARDRVLDRIIALKLLREEYGANRDFVARFYREARAAASLQHPNIVDIYDYGPHEGTYFIVMQYVEGTNLKTLLRREGALPPGRAVAVTAQVLRALAVAHAHGIIHRDVKPQNILVRESDGIVKLTDFGIARARDGLDLTTSGATLGTAHYMAPEQARGGPIGPQTDLYAAGVVLFELLAGRLPFDAANHLRVMLQHLHDPPPDLPHGVPPMLNQVVRRALAKEPARRFQSAGEMLAALEAARAARSGRVAHRPRPPVTTRGPVDSTRPRDRVAPVPAGRLGTLLAPLLLVLFLLGLLLGGLALARSYTAGSRAAADNPTGGPVAEATLPAVVPPAPAVVAPSPTTAPTPPPLPAVAPTAPPMPTALPILAPTATPAAPRPTPTTPPPRPTATPAPPRPTATAPPPAAAPGTTALRVGAGELAGAYRRTDGTLYGRPEVALYGAGSGYNEASIGLRYTGDRAGQVVLLLVGLDDERGEHCGMQIILNGVVVFDGRTAFPNVPTSDNGVGGPDRYWGQMRVAVPASAFRVGNNTLTIRNTTPWQGALGIPYFLINELVIGD